MKQESIETNNEMKGTDKKQFKQSSKLKKAAHVSAVVAGGVMGGENATAYAEKGLSDDAQEMSIESSNNDDIDFITTDGAAWNAEKSSKTLSDVEHQGDNSEIDEENEHSEKSVLEESKSIENQKTNENDDEGQEEHDVHERTPTTDQINQAERIMMQSKKDVKKELQKFPKINLNPFSSKESQKSIITEMKEHIGDIKAYIADTNNRLPNISNELKNLINIYISSLDSVKDIHVTLYERERENILMYLDFIDSQSVMSLANADKEDFQEWKEQQ